MLSVALLTILGIASVEAHKGCGGGEIMRRNPGGPLIQRDDTTWQQEAALGKQLEHLSYA
jgi:hypothetical protein